uniref:Uncharacterized protein n=1 Tax=Glossina pallidipes TaxID=7398 RepID=A0A1A9ZXM1_GLOPL
MEKDEKGSRFRKGQVVSIVCRIVSSIAVVFLCLGLQCCSTLKQWIISSQQSTKLRSNVTFEISTTINPSPSLQWLQYQNERFEYEKPRHTNLKTNLQNSLRRSNGHIELELESNRTMTTTSQNLSEIKDTADDSDKKGNKEIPSKPTISKGLIHKNVISPSFDGFKAFLQSASQMWINGHSFGMNNKTGLLQKLKEKLLKAIGQLELIIEEQIVQYNRTVDTLKEALVD